MIVENFEFLRLTNRRPLEGRLVFMLFDRGSTQLIWMLIRLKFYHHQTK